MSRRERFWLTAAIVTALALIVWFLMQDNQKAEAQATVPTASAAPEPPPDIVRYYQAKTATRSLVRVAPKPAAVPKKVVSKPQASKPRAASVSGSVSQFLECVAHHESRGNYRAENPYSTASGKYQFIDSSWRAYSRMAGYPGWSHAAYAPPAVQDAVAAWVVVNKGHYPWVGTHCGYGT